MALISPMVLNRALEVLILILQLNLVMDTAFSNGGIFLDVSNRQLVRIKGNTGEGAAIGAITGDAGRYAPASTPNAYELDFDPHQP